jgi:polar amino acid transport system substrate-binding protein
MKNVLFRILRCAALIATVVLSRGIVYAGTLDDIKAKNLLRVGVKADYPPFGYISNDREFKGLEVDLAYDVANRLGVKLELVPVTTANRMQYLQEGKIDLMIASMSISPERERTVGVISPAYYASGVGILARKSSNIEDETNLENKTICTISGAFYAADLKTIYVKRDLILFKTQSEAANATLQGQCDGFVSDDVQLIYKTKVDPDKWRDFNYVQLSEFDPLPWGIAVRLQDKNTAWGQFVQSTVRDWLMSDKLLAVEQKWLGRNTVWLKAVHTRMLAGNK